MNRLLGYRFKNHISCTNNWVTLNMLFEFSNNFVAALKADKKRLKAEKFDLLSQMKQLYATLEDKEKELRDFIRNYEQVRWTHLAYKSNEMRPVFLI